MDGLSSIRTCAIILIYCRCFRTVCNNFWVVAQWNTSVRRSANVDKYSKSLYLRGLGLLWIACSWPGVPNPCNVFALHCFRRCCNSKFQFYKYTRPTLPGNVHRPMQPISQSQLCYLSRILHFSIFLLSLMTSVENEFIFKLRSYFVLKIIFFYFHLEMKVFPR